MVTASYTDEVTQITAGGSRLLTGTLQATYFDAAVTPIAYDFVRERNGSVTSTCSRTGPRSRCDDRPDSVCHWAIGS